MRLGLGRFTSQLGPVVLDGTLRIITGPFSSVKVGDEMYRASGLHSGRVVGNICYH